MVVQGTTDLAGCCKAFYDLPSETPGHYFCHILLVNQVTQGSTYWTEGYEASSLNDRVSKEFVAIFNLFQTTLWPQNIYIFPTCILKATRVSWIMV